MIKEIRLAYSEYEGMIETIEHLKERIAVHEGENVPITLSNVHIPVRKYIVVCGKYSICEHRDMSLFTPTYTLPRSNNFVMLTRDEAIKQINEKHTEAVKEYYEEISKLRESEEKALDTYKGIVSNWEKRWRQRFKFWKKW